MDAYNTIKRGVNKFSAILYKCVWSICTFMLLAVVLVISLEVILRFVFGRGFAWTTEVGTLFLQYVAFASMVLGVKYKLHISLMLVYDNVPKKLQWCFDKFSYLCTMVFGFLFCYHGFALTRTLWGATLPATRWPQGVTYMICVFSGAIIFYESIAQLFGLNDAKADELDDEDDIENKEGDAIV